MDGIKYHGDVKQMEERLPSLPGCDRFHRGWLGVAKKEILPFIEALNPGDTVFCLFNTQFFASFGDIQDDKKYKNVLLSRALVGGLQDRILIVTQHGKSIFQIPYADVDKVKQSNQIAKDGEINIIEKNGTKANFFLDTISTDTELLGSRFCSWVNKNIQNSEDGKGKSDKEITYDTGINYFNLSVKDLKEILRKRGLPVGGESNNEEEYRSELIARLQKDDYKFDDRIDARDLKLREEIIEKYKAPEYEAIPLPARIVYPAYPLYLSILTFFLYCLTFFIIILHTYRLEGTGGWENKPLYTISDVTIGYVQAYLLSWIGFIILCIYILYRNSGRKVEKTPTILNNVGGLLIIIIIFVMPLLYFLTDLSLTIPFRSCLILLVLIILLESPFDLQDRSKEIKKEQEEKRKERKWFDACKYEDNSDYTGALRIWLNLNEDKQVLRLETLLLELKYVKTRRRILNMEEKGINCSELKENLRIAQVLINDIDYYKK